MIFYTHHQTRFVKRGESYAKYRNPALLDRKSGVTTGLSGVTVGHDVIRENMLDKWGRNINPFHPRVSAMDSSTF